MRKVTIGKQYYNKGKRYEVLGETAEAILLKVTYKGRDAYNVIDFCEELPEKSIQFEELNPFRSLILEEAKEEYKDRNQLKIV